MFKNFLLACLLTAFIGLNNFAQSEVSPRASIFDDPGYANPLPVLKELVKEKAKTRKNTFYISKIRDFDSAYPKGFNDFVYVYWKEDNALILWEAYQLGSDSRKYELALARRYRRFGKEIVSPSRYSEGTDYLILMKDGLAIRNECKRAGAKFVVLKLSRRKRKA